ncbi:MAG: hypothetical protein GY856_06430, partial [bacterium]|nr:hypothetical protein [bacterium]
SVLLVVTLGLAAGVGWQHLELSRLEGEQQALDTARREQRRKHQQEQQRATQELRKRKAQQRQDRETIAELEQRLQASAPAVAEAAAPVVNLAFALFTSVGAVRGEAKTVTVPPATRFLLILEVSEVFPVYRLEIRKQDIGTPVWESSELTRTGRRELTVLLPRSLFPDDQYQLRLAGLRDGRAVPLEEYLLRLASP